ncbi:MAG: ATP-binding cassette domain-containing protein [Tannerella sp.]|jgi:molybdate transport system ATP-binding protein|nr:ATP-binding cassette domain-containing protein [Tannerella sp.]
MIIVDRAVGWIGGEGFREAVSLRIEAGEHVAFVGPNGGGKSTLAQMIIGKYPLREGSVIYGFSPAPVYKNIRFIAFKDSYGPADATYYLQQRWNSQDRDASPSVRDSLGDISGNDLESGLFELFGVNEMLDKQTVMLSSGEMRKFQLTKALLARPRIIIIDNPFIGLDAGTRTRLGDLLESLVRMGEVQVILLLSRTDEIPDFITHVIPVRDMRCGQKTRLCDYRENTGLLRRLAVAASMASLATNLLHSEKAGDTIIEMRNVSIKYGERTILDSINWTVKRGEKWALLGQNGSGKSTLLSLVCADNPQSYSCDISLFGARRGTGESIWDIKKRIGYVSPETHRAYSENIPAIEIVASGLFDSVGLYVRPHPEQYAVCEWWMNVFGILGLRDRNFLQLSDGEQRLVLLSRAFVKNPELLILDEPLHGLDLHNRNLVNGIIEKFCEIEDKTLVTVTHYEDDLPKCITNKYVLTKH